MAGRRVIFHAKLVAETLTNELDFGDYVCMGVVTKRDA